MLSLVYLYGECRKFVSLLEYYSSAFSMVFSLAIWFIYLDMFMLLLVC